MVDRGEGLPGFTVRGGAGGIEARYDDLALLGRLYASTGDRLAGWAWEDKLVAADGDLLASAVLAPATFAAAEAAVLEATVGPRGLAVRAAALAAESVCFRACVDLYRTADEARHAALEALHYGLGHVVGVELPGALLAGGAAYAGLRAGGVEDEEMIGWLEDHPGVVETSVGAGGGLLDGLAVGALTAPAMAALGLTGFHADTGAAADDLGDLLFGSYAGELAQDFPTDACSLDAPHDVGDLLDDLGQVVEQPDGVLAVETLTGPDGGVRHVVHLPGTDDFLAEDTVRNLGSNLSLVAGEDTAYGDAVGQALAAAGVGAGEPVMLVGHSQGGMQAAALAADPGFPFDVTHVVTAGSPVATAGIPADVTVLSLENTGDVVPLLDGEPNADSAHHTTVQADLHSGSFGAEPGQNHSLEVYGDLAAAVDASEDPGLQVLVAGLHDAGFLSAPGEQVSTATSTFQAQHGGQVSGPRLDGWQQALP